MTVLAIDCSTRRLGWCASTAGVDRPEERPQYDLILLPGMSSLPRLYGAVRNSLCDLVERFQPAVMAWCRPMHRDAQTAAEALLGVAAVAHLVCHDYSVRPMPEHEAQARKAILGRGSFGQRDAAGKIIKGSGTAAAKIAAMRWCERRGFHPQSDDVADAIVLCAYVRQQLAKRRAA